MELTDFLQQAAVSLREQETGEQRWGALLVPGQFLVPAAAVKRLNLTMGDGLARDDAGNFLAARHGFPVLRIMAKEGREGAADDAGTKTGLIFSVLPLVEIADDALTARLNLLPPGQDGGLPPFAELLARIGTCGVAYGLDQEEVRRCYDEVLQNNVPVTNHLIASGNPPTPGRDAMLRMEVETGAIPGQLLADGRIDFRERRIFVAVGKDQLLAVKIAATNGINGINVRGEVIVTRDGADIAVQTTDLCAFNPEDGTIRATAPGVLSVAGGSFHVAAKQTINGDVDLSTGNIRLQDNVEITGSVSPGFTVASRGDIKIGGDVQSALVDAQGNIVIAGGVVGENSDISAKGDVDLKFIERGKVTSGGSVHIRASAYYSDISAAGDIVGGPGSRFIGGDIRCGGSIAVESAGSVAGVGTTLAAGLHLSRYRRHAEIRARCDELTNALTKLVQHRGKNNLDCEAYADIEEELNEMERELASLNLASDGERQASRHMEKWRTNAQIHITGPLRAGVTIRLGNATMVAECDYAALSIFQDAETGALAIAPLGARDKNVR